ncbi:MAG: translation elongation factor Ts [Xanthomonadaceae bacterium]|nr:translation elongation factor Ts [Xanthomonadaceae bacterium]
MSITAQMVKELRERTGSGMMECKKALVETGGDLDAAVELMRKQGLAKADKKAGRIAAEGAIIIEQSGDGKRAVMVEVNCETDFVATGAEFRAFAEGVARTALESGAADVDALMASGTGGKTLDESRRELVAKIGENITVRRFALVERAGDRIGTYLHGTRIGVLVDVAGGDDDLARDLAMHIAASRPVCVDESGVPADLLAKEREIIAAQSQQEGKPAAIIEKMVEGRLRKYLAEITLLGQPFVKNPDQTVSQLVKAAGATVHAFMRMEVGEGIEKKSEDFAEEVRKASQV